MELQMPNDAVYPSIVVEIGGELFSVNSSHISGILQLRDYRKLPNSPPEIRGMFQERGSTIILVDLRATLRMNSLESQYLSFCNMIDERKQDHIRWVNALKQTVEEGVPFTLATDCHQCALGKWRDAFHSDISEVNWQLKQLDRPHGLLHHSAEIVLELREKGDTPEIQGEILNTYKHVRDGYMPAVLKLLEETKEVFHTSVFREMILTLNDLEGVGVIVDKVLSVENLSPISDASIVDTFLNVPYVLSVQRSEKIPGLILEMSLSCLLDQIGGLEDLKQTLAEQDK